VVSGTLYLGDVLVTMPATVQAGQTYGAQITAAGGTFQSNAIPLATGASATLTVVLDYLVGDSFPYTGDNIGQFGDNSINTLDLIATLRVASAIPGYTPPSGCDRFDAMDAYPPDTATTRGGNGAINTLDLIVVLQRATNIDQSRPRRISRGLSCPTVALPGVAPPSLAPPSLAAPARVGNPRDAEASLELVTTADGGADVYLQALRDLHLAGLAFSVGSTNGAATLRWTNSEATAPSLVDSSLASTLAAAWLSNLDLAAGGRLLLGHVATDVAAPLVLHGGSANVQGSGNDVKLMIGGVLRAK
jgi:hypothetical protein